METFEHGGNFYKINRRRNFKKDDWIDFSANINPLGLPDELKHCILQNIDEIEHYPDPKSVEFIDGVCQRFSVKPENVIAGNGASELFFILVRVIEKPRVVIISPSYSDYERAALIERREIEYVDLKEEENFELRRDRLESKLKGNEIVILGRPNNPTGTFVSKSDLLELVKNHPNSFFFVDEAFIDFVSSTEDIAGGRIPEKKDTQRQNAGESLCGMILPNLIVVLSLTKMYSVAGLRIGLAIGPAQCIGRAKSMQSSWPLNTFAQNAGLLIMQNPSLVMDHAEATRKYIDMERNRLFEKLAEINQIRVFPSRVNFLLFKITAKEIQPEKLYEYMLDNGIMIRSCDNFRGLDSSFYRMAVLGSDENNAFIDVLKNFFILYEGSSVAINQSSQKNAAKNLIRANGSINGLKKKKTPALMILGTGSNVGKSLLTAAFCRIFLNEGLRVYPFKAQNMSLNSCVTLDGMEMSRAQYLQAQAARVEPDVRMNPVLLKPVGKLTSQIILLGKPIGNRGYAQYRDSKEEIQKTVHRAYDDLAANADLMLLEGAGSPVEMNLKSHDIVNMAMAKYADARVILAGNIDFGGIYASLAGTLMLLNKNERRRVAGLIVNQFRGDDGLFKEGRQLLEKMTGKSVVGVIPYVDKLLLPDEDSMAFSVRRRPGSRPENLKSLKSFLNIFVVRLPHMSNFTDFDPFFQQEEITITFLETPDQTGGQIPDAVIIPGSKNVISDMMWLNESEFSKYICRLRENGKTEIIGLCGGFQMLGKTIRDPFSIESDRGEIDGLGMLEMTTSLAHDKTLRRFSGRHIGSGIIVSGYEIHHGITEGREKPVLEAPDIAGFTTVDGRVWGTYIHGLFDNDEFRLWFYNNLLRKKNLPPLENVILYDIDSALENFAAIVKNSLDMDAIRKAVFG